MSEIRKNFLTNELVLMASERLKRPINFIDEKHEFYIDEKDCPFCFGNEIETPGIIFESENRQCRITKNKFPAIEGKFGFHEVAIDTKIHKQKFCELEIQEISEVLQGLQSREKFYVSKSDIKYVQIFKNNGQNAGASMEHSHWQIMALSYIPSKIQVIKDNLKKYKEKNKICYLCSLKENVDCFTICENESFKAVTMYASVYAFGVTIISKNHINSFSDCTKKEIHFLSEIIGKIVVALENMKPNISYNILFYSGEDETNHFFVEIVPRIGKFGGYELSTNNYINSVLPEIACEKLKKLLSNVHSPFSCNNFWNE